MYTYNWYQWLLFFYIYCFIGWCIESAYVSLKKKKFVNRGFLRVPMLPLYGSGAVLMLFVSIPVRDHMVFVFLSGMAAATILEYVTGVCMEKLFKVRYWDYSTNKFQFQGQICLGTSICWGFLSIALIEFIHAPLENMVKNITPTATLLIVGMITIIFVTDTYFSVRAALDVGKAIQAITIIRTEWQELQLQLEELKEAAKKQLEEFQESAEHRLEEWKDSSEKQMTAMKGRMRVLKEEREQTLINNVFARSRLLRRNPSAHSKWFNEALKELKDHAEDKLRNKKIKK